MACVLTQILRELDARQAPAAPAASQPFAGTLRGVTEAEKQVTAGEAAKEEALFMSCLTSFWGKFVAFALMFDVFCLNFWFCC